MAATLVRIKAQMLLPRPEGDEDEDPGLSWSEGSSNMS